MPDPIPEGYTSVTPYLCLADCAAAIQFYQNAFGAREIIRLPMPGGQGTMHAEIRIGGSHIMMGDESQGGPSKMRAPANAGANTGGIHLYVEDVDATFKQAVDAGAAVLAPIWDAFRGDRIARLRDPFGHEWTISTHMEDVEPDEIARRSEEFFAKMAREE